MEAATEHSAVVRDEMVEKEAGRKIKGLDVISDECRLCGEHSLLFVARV